MGAVHGFSKGGARPWWLWRQVAVLHGYQGLTPHLAYLIEETLEAPLYYDCMGSSK